MTQTLLESMTIYGLFTLTHHGGNRVLTVMSDAGAKAALAQITVTDGVTMKARAGYLTQYWAQRKGAFEHLVATNGIVVLEKTNWDRKKEELGERIF